MNFFQFLLTFVAMVIFGCLTICGWYWITRGEWETMPDGKKVARGKIFKWWYLLINKKKGYKEIEYIGTTMVNLVSKFPELKDGCIGIKTNKDPNQYSWYLSRTEISPFLENKLLQEEGIIMKYIGMTEHNHFKYRIYLKDPVYYVPAWLRRPLANCPTCFASIYGTLFYIFFLSLVPGVFSWAQNPQVAVIFYWVVYCFNLAVLNTFVARLLEKE